VDSASLNTSVETPTASTTVPATRTSTEQCPPFKSTTADSAEETTAPKTHADSAAVHAPSTSAETPSANKNPAGKTAMASSGQKDSSTSTHVDNACPSPCQQTHSTRPACRTAGASFTKTQTHPPCPWTNVAYAGQPEHAVPSASKTVKASGTAPIP
jgi:hypothetical protein